MQKRMKEISELNRNIKINDIVASEFSKYGQKLNIGLKGIFKTAKNSLEINKDGVDYFPWVDALESNVDDKKLVENLVYGQMEAQIGYCAGQNTKMNAMEFHMGSEVIIAISDIILLLGDPDDIKIVNGKWSYDSKNIEVFYMESGEVAEIYTKVLHYAPIQVDKEGFKSVIILPRNTNTKLANDNEKSKYLVAKNKWLFVHEDLTEGEKGIFGDNIEIKID